MNTLLVAVLLALAVAVSAGGHWGHHDDGQWHGNHGPWDDGQWHGGHGGWGHGWGHGGWAGGWAGHGHGGVVVKGPHTVPATIVGPSGKVHADGLYGVGHGHHGHHW